MSETRDPILEEANRRAHKVARASVRLREAKFFRAPAAELVRLDELLHQAMGAYEEIQQRQIEEATR